VHAPSFAAALHSALREDPDVILVGELRDLETMSIAVTAAEMGILVMGTLHTNGAAQTVDRMVNAFPADKQSHVRTMLSTSLRGVMSQQLLRKADKQRPRRGAGDPDQHAGGRQPDPPGQARSAGKHHAGRRLSSACAPWTAPSRRCSTPARSAAPRPTRRDQQGEVRAVQGPGLSSARQRMQ
jgi:type II secretory ATPase GspE/PulE/Tfp pilus assembly ATPase PilB-like protein